jgi:hypothetical protein
MNEYESFLSGYNNKVLRSDRVHPNRHHVDAFGSRCDGGVKKRFNSVSEKKGGQNLPNFLWACSMIRISRALTILIFDLGNLIGVAMVDLWDGQKKLWDNETRCKVLREMREEILLIIFF